MHPNPAFRAADVARNLAFARDRGFGALAVNGSQGPLVSHVPFLVDAAGGAVELHLVRSNPIVAALTDPQKAVLAVQGPDGYVSPDWYGLDDQVPTWNYVAVHLRGRLERLPQDALHPMLDRLSAAFEAHLAPKPPWTSAKMSDGTMARMMRAIVPCRLTISAVDGTWKLNQNKPAPARLAAAQGVAEAGVGADTARLSDWMHEPPT